MEAYQPRCKPCRDSDPTRYYLTCAGCLIRREYANRAKVEPIVCPEVEREVFPTSFPPMEKSK